MTTSSIPRRLGAPLADLVARAEAAGIEVELANADGTTHSFVINAADGQLTPAAVEQGETGQDNDAGETNG